MSPYWATEWMTETEKAALREVVRLTDARNGHTRGPGCRCRDCYVPEYVRADLNRWSPPC
jgi:hypothetical protein